MDKLNIQLYDGQITTNFNIDEFKCRANGEMIINADVIAHIQRLQKFRDWYRRVMIITSGYRTVEYNAQVNGAPDSQHLLGLASDILYPDEYYGFMEKRKNEFLSNIKNKWESLCKIDNIQGGCGWYNTFFHLDSRAGTYSMAFWDDRTK